MKYIECNIEQLIKNLSSKKIICYGASGAFDTIYQSIELFKKFNQEKCDSPYFDIESDDFNYNEFNLVDNILFFVDSDIKKWGKEITFNQKVFEIHSPEKILDYINNTVLLITSSYYNEIAEQLNAIEEFDNLEYYVYNTLNKNYSTKSIGYYFSKLVDPSLGVYRQYLINKGICKADIFNYMDNMLKEMIHILNSGGIILPSVGFKLTTKCTLRCKNCIDLIPHYSNASHCDINQVLKDIDIILNSVDKCMFVHLVSGETLLYPDLDKVLKKLVESEKVYAIGLTTNGTTLPLNKNAIQYMKHEKVTLGISDYGIIEKMSKIVSFCEKNNIRFNVIDNMKWIDTGRYPKFRGVDKKQLQDEFSKCYLVQDCPKLMQNATLFACGKTAKFFDLGVYESENDYEILQDNDSIDEIKRKIMRIMFLYYIEGCNYCDVFTHGYSNGQKVWVKAGLQLDGGNEYIKSEYTLVKRKN